jgi:hypothetical protein
MYVIFCNVVYLIYNSLLHYLRHSLLQHVHKYGSKYLRCEMYKTKVQIAIYPLPQFALQTIAKAYHIQSILL